MALRQYTDRTGITWDVWDVPAQYTAMRSGADRRRTHTPGFTPERRTRPDRRTRRCTGMEGGWICFQSEAEKRRLVPAPPDWPECSEEQLEGYLDRAAPVALRTAREQPAR